MTITVYSVSGAPRGWRVLLGLTFKGLNYETKYLEASKGEHKSEPFLTLNPRGTVPVLVQDDFILRDSLGILAWLDSAYPEKPLFGRTLSETANVWQITLECCDYLRAAINDLLAPILVRGEALPEAGTPERLAWETAAAAYHKECNYLENLLAKNPFLASDVPSAADAVAFPEVRLIERAVDTKPDIMKALGLHDTDDTYPRIAAWKKQISALPGFDSTLPRHW
ncbi:glutathione S-transferase family protein [Kordiimonas aquimaris]|uniref:glutathione S-transferase family protein n=1 Tax=Kordiimonas aquimaris TaxID=707591 RepID=UPI0021D13C0F|nr:glutathione S-transferase family protein [Kordiimonas aquimaris]